MTEGLDLAGIVAIEALIPPVLRRRISFIAYAIFAVTERTLNMLSNNILKSTLAIAFVAAFAVAVQAEEKPSGAEGVLLNVEGTVTAIDLNTREVTVRDAEGEESVVQVGPDARNLDQVEVGDNVSIEYFGGLIFNVEPAGSGKPMRVEKTEMSRAAEGVKPSGFINKYVELVARVEDIDTKARTVTLQGPNQTVTLSVKEDVELATVKKGDMVKADFVESFAVNVTENERSTTTD